MASINGVDDHSKFFPIKIETNSTNNINGNNHDNSIANTATNGSDFQMLFKSILESPMNNGRGSLDGNGKTGVANSLSLLPGIDKNTSTLLTLLEQLQQPDSLSQSEVQSDDKLLSQILSGFDKVVGKNSADPISNISYTQVISKYMQAMSNSQNAFKALAAGANMNTVNGILSGKSSMVQGISDIDTPGVNPTKQQIINYITEQSKEIGIPEQLALATAATESEMTQFNKDGSAYRNSNPGSTDWGIMQINDKAWGDTYDFNLIKSDWKYNIRAGLQILKANYDAAVKNNEGLKGVNNTDQNLARAAYSGYNAGTGNLWRYRTPVDNAPQTNSYNVLNNDGYDVRDIRFWDNYQKLS